MVQDRPMIMITAEHIIGSHSYPVDPCLLGCLRVTVKGRTPSFSGGPHTFFSAGCLSVLVLFETKLVPFDQQSSLGTVNNPRGEWLERPNSAW